MKYPLKYLKKQYEYLSKFEGKLSKQLGYLQPEDLEWNADNDDKRNIIHYFTNSRAELERDIQRLKMQIVANGAIWISWPKKASKIQTDLDGNSIRGIGLQSALVDLKVCAVSDIWSGLKFVIPLKER